MEVIEQFIQSKTGDMATCEDGYLITEHFVALVDGATNKSTMQYDGDSPGKVATRLCLDVFKVLPPESSAIDAVTAMNESIISFYRQKGVYDLVKNNPSARCTASSVVYSAARKELWFLGDCMAIANGKVYQFQKNLDQVLSNLRSLVIHVERSRGATEADLLAHDVSRERILEFLQLQTELQNSPYACEFTYHVLDGIFDRPQDHIHIVPIDGTSDEVVLSSDGYPQVFPTLEETERHLADTITSDPLCYKIFKSTKGVVEGNVSFDDRSYIRFTI